MDTNEGKIYIVPTPIGNLGDMTARALEALRMCDAVYAEDTRVTGKLLAAFDIRKPMRRLDENTIRQRSSDVLDRVLAGEKVCYCTDAGMPGVSDPGSILVAAAHELGATCEVLPGACAASLAYVASGFSCPNHYFGCFFPRKRSEQCSVLESLSHLDAALIFYESPHRLLDSLRSIEEVLPKRKVCVCRELTKLHEEVFVGSPDEALSHFRAMEDAGGIKGEIVIVIDSAGTEELRSRDDDAAKRAEQLVVRLISEGERVKTAAAKAAEAFGIPKNQAYQIALAAKEDAADV